MSEKRTCSQCGGSMAERWRLLQRDPDEALCERCCEVGRLCRQCGRPHEDDRWRLYQGDPNDALCERCWENSSWGPAGAKQVGADDE